MIREAIVNRIARRSFGAALLQPHPTTPPPITVQMLLPSPAAAAAAAAASAAVEGLARPPMVHDRTRSDVARLKTSTKRMPLAYSPPRPSKHYLDVDSLKDSSNFSTKVDPSRDSGRRCRRRRHSLPSPALAFLRPPSPSFAPPSPSSAHAPRSPKRT